jgi:hypothetical protein
MSLVGSEPRAENYYDRKVSLLRTAARLRSPADWGLTADSPHPHVTQEQCSLAVRALAEAAGVSGAERMTGHGATALEATGASKLVIMEAGGWASESSMLRYIEPGPEARGRESARLLAAPPAGRGPERVRSDAAGAPHPGGARRPARVPTAAAATGGGAGAVSGDGDGEAEEAEVVAAELAALFGPTPRPRQRGAGSGSRLQE